MPVLVLCGLIFWQERALAHETDQHTVCEGREYADVGFLLSRWHYEAIHNGVNKVNAEIKDALDHHRSESDIRALQSDDHLVRVVNHEFPWAGKVIDGWDDLLRSQQMEDEFPGYVVAYKHPFANIYQHTHNIIDPRQFFRIWLGSNLNAYGHNIGTDKIGHFTDEGMNYYNVWHKARMAGDDEKTAVKKAIFLGTDDFLLGEKGMLGLLTAGDYANGDLTSNWLGFSFYRNLTEPWPLAGKTQPPMCVRDGHYWKLSPHVRVDSDFFRVFVTEGEDEALNPGYFEVGMRPALRAAIKARREKVLEHYVDEHGCRRPKWWFDEQLDKTNTYYGQYYGHWGNYDEVVSIGATCFTPFKADADVKARDLSGETPLHQAAWNGDVAMVKEQLARGADPNAQVRSNEGANADWGSTPLHFAAARGSAQVVRMLIAAGADVNARNDMGVTPLHRAVRFPDVAAILLQHGAKALAVDARGRTPLHWAASDEENCSQVASLLLSNGASANIKDHEGRTPLHMAAESGDQAVAHVLLARGADVNAADYFGQTPLHLAAAQKFSPMTEVLLASGAKANAVDYFGCTALCDAARVGAADNVTALLRAGASPTLANSFGTTPLEVAREAGCDTIVAQLSESPEAVVASHIQGP